MKQTILVAGATGNLGARIVKALTKMDVNVRVLVRKESDIKTINEFERIGVEVFPVDFSSKDHLKLACAGVSCVVSVLAGLRDVIIDRQKCLLDAAVAAGVPRFIPSDYSLDFTKFSHGENRNLDLRREFHAYLDKQPIAATSVFNNAFTELLVNEMPLIFFKQKLILYWGDVDHRMGFTTMDDTAAYTANVALDPMLKRYHHIAGDVISPRELRLVAKTITGEKFRMFRPGGLGFLSFMIKVVRKLSPVTNELYPAWQGMQYMRNMIDKRADLSNLDNNRYPYMRWTTVKDVIEDYCLSNEVKK